jgi:hypothetical protein
MHAAKATIDLMLSRLLVARPAFTMTCVVHPLPDATRPHQAGKTPTSFFWWWCGKTRERSQMDRVLRITW